MSQAPVLPKLYSAISKVQSEIKRAEKKANNPHLKRKYADLGATWEACRDALSEHGVSVIQMPTMLDGDQALMTILAHESGEALESTIKLTPDKQGGPQGMGSSLTYFRRYALQAALGICPEDDDAVSAQERHSKGGHRAAPQQPESKKVKASEKQISGLWAIVSKRVESKEVGHRMVHFAHWKKHRPGVPFSEITTKDMTSTECAAVAQSFSEDEKFDKLDIMFKDWDSDQVGVGE